MSVSVFPHLGRDSLLACTTVKSRKVLAASASILKVNCLHHLKINFFFFAMRVLIIFSLKIQDKKKREEKRKQEQQ